MASVSIRSPHRSKGRHFVRVVSGAACLSFNPLPSPKQGETFTRRSPHPHRFVSIRSPHRSKGRPRPRSRPRRSHSRFNPLPSPKQGETHANDIVGFGLAMFQSAPLTEARGDLDLAEASLACNRFQSAPLTEARGDARPSLLSSSTYSFQSAPLTEARGDSTRPGSSRGPACFNPLPSPKQGETSSRTTPGSSAGSFQSAPLTEARGDAGFCNQRNTKELREWMREPPFIRISLLKRELMPRCKLLLAIKLPTARK